MHAPTLALGIAVTLPLFAGVVLSGHAIAARLLPGAPASARLAGAAVVATWLPVAAFWALAPFGAFRLEIVLGAAVVAAATGRRRLVPAAAALRDDLRAAADAWRNAGPVRWLALAAAVPVAVAAARGLIAPPLAWDALTYHLVHAARYVQTGGLGAVDAPGAWGYYEYFPPSGEALWAWAMLPSRSDALLAAAGLAVWASAALAVYALVRELGGTRPRAFLGAVLVAGSPSVGGFVTSTYVDPLVVSLFAATTLFLARAARTGAAGDLLLAGAAAGVCASTKHSGLALLALLAFALPAAALGAPGPARERLRGLAYAALAAAAAALPHYVRTLAETGNPVYPAALGLLGLAGNEAYVTVVAGTGAPLPAIRDLAWRMFLAPGTAIQAPLHLGPAALAALVAAPAGLPALLRSARGRRVVAWLAASSAIVVAALLSPDARGIVEAWWDISGRFLGPALVAVAVLAALAPGRLVPGVLAAAAVATLFHAWPRGLGDPGRIQAGWGLLAAAVAAGGGLLAARATRAPLRAAVVVATVAAVSLGLAALRDRHRIPTWQAAAEGRTFDLHVLGRPAVMAWPLWAHFDDGPPATLAVAAGPALRGHNVFQYPLMGRGLANRTIHVVPPTPAQPAGAPHGGHVGPDPAAAASPDGLPAATVPGGPASADRPASDLGADAVQTAVRVPDAAAWLARLRAAGADHVVLLPPLPPAEAAAVATLPDAFRVVARGIAGQGVALRLSSTGRPPRSAPSPDR